MKYWVVFGALFLCILPRISFAPLPSGDCWTRLFEKLNRPEKGPKIAIAPFENKAVSKENQGEALILRVLLSEYLQAAGVAAVRGSEGEYKITGKLLPKETGVAVEVHFLAGDNPKGSVTAPLPQGAALNDLLIALIDAADRAFPEMKIKSKKVLPYLHRTGSNEELLLFSTGVLALDKGTRAGVAEAIRLLGQAIEKDYNSTPAYLALAEGYAAQSLIGRIDHVREIGTAPAEGLELKARMRYQTAELLNPPLAEWKKPRIMRYLTTDNKDIEKLCAP